MGFQGAGAAVAVAEIDKRRTSSLRIRLLSKRATFFSLVSSQLMYALYGRGIARVAARWAFGRACRAAPMPLRLSNLALCQIRDKHVATALCHSPDSTRRPSSDCAFAFCGKFLYAPAIVQRSATGTAALELLDRMVYVRLACKAALSQVQAMGLHLFKHVAYESRPLR